MVGKDLVDVILDRGFVRRFFSFEFIVLVFLKLVTENFSTHPNKSP